MALGKQAGTARFNAQVGLINRVSTPAFNMSVTLSGTSIVGTATWTATYSTIFGKLMGVTVWPMSGSVAANTPTGVVFLNVEVMLDDSPSMMIGATDSDVATMQWLTPCSSVGAVYNADSSDNNGTQPTAGAWYHDYQCISSGNSYDGHGTCPIAAGSPYTFASFRTTAALAGPSCQGWLPKQSSTGRYPLAGAPCGFACHWDSTKPAGTGNDYFAIARSTIGQSNQVTLRFDVIKAAVNSLISAMQVKNTSLNNLKIGVFTFDLTLNQVYPTSVSSGAAGSNWAAATQAVGAPPTSANQADTGIQPFVSGNAPSTDFPDTMQTLYSTYLSASGDGTSAATPKKVLFLVTDGLEDYPEGSNRTIAAVDPSYCQKFKDWGYTVYVLYTPYYPLMNDYYLDNVYSIAEGSGSGSLSYNLQSCASSPNDYIAASDSASIQAALLAFLQSALTAANAHLSE